MVGSSNRTPNKFGLTPLRCMSKLDGGYHDGQASLASLLGWRFLVIQLRRSTKNRSYIYAVVH